MAIENTNSAVLFGRNKAAAAAPVQELKRSEFWLNIGYEIDVEGETVFVSLPIGIAVDTQAELSEQSSNDNFSKLQAARNKLKRDLVAYLTNALKPGEDEILGLVVQARRVREIKSVSTGSDNPFAAELNFSGK